MSSNQLGTEKSPYLKQHASNPVWWHPWGEKAFQAAKDQQKPIFLSIGYATCYWCHVMEKDSFEKKEVAEVLNELFIAIKLDREERPDVDRIYMDTVVALTGQGGWPLSVALTPDLKPFWAGTFFYKDQFIEILRALARAWREDREKVVESAAEITQEIFKEIQQNPSVNALDFSPIERAVNILAQNFDSKFGGFGDAPKFPPPNQIGLLLRYAKNCKDAIKATAALEIAKKTLDALISGGIYDQVAGGFHRYATDKAWLIPHFEKMLYDNAQLCEVLVEAYQATTQVSYLEAARDCADYVLRDLRSQEGAFFAAEDAGEVDQEGEYYVWTFAELSSILSKVEFDKCQEYFSISEQGNFEHQSNVLSLRSELESKQTHSFKIIREKLIEQRKLRKRPLTDTKILTSWNALMATALIKLYSASQDTKYLDSAKTALNFILNNLCLAQGLFRRYAEREAGIAACLDDYSFLIQSLIELFCVSGEYRWFNEAYRLQEEQDKLLWNEDVGAYYDSAAKELISRKIDFTDGATPAGNSIAAINLIKLSRLTGNPDYLARSKRILLSFSESFVRYPQAVTKALQALDLYLSESSEIVISKSLLDHTSQIEEQIGSKFLPHAIVVWLREPCINQPLLDSLLSGKSARDKSLIYVCSGHTCKLPLAKEELSELL